MPRQKFQIGGLADEGGLVRPEGGGADVEVVGMDDVTTGLVIEDEEGDADLADDAAGGAHPQFGVPLTSAVKKAEGNQETKVGIRQALGCEGPA